MARYETHSPSAGERGEHKSAFHPGKAFSDTDSQTTAKRKVGELGAGFARFRTPAFRIELVGFGEEPRITMGDVLAHDDERPGRDAITIDLVIDETSPSDDPRRGIEPNRL